MFNNILQMDTQNEKLSKTDVPEPQLLAPLIEKLRAHISDLTYVLQVYDEQPKLKLHPKFIELLLKNQETLHKIIITCLEPQTLTFKLGKWPYIAKKLLKENPDLVIYLGQSNLHWVFEFVTEELNDLSFAYFSEIISIENSNKLIHCSLIQLVQYLLNHKPMFDTLMAKTHHAEIFKFLFTLATNFSLHNNQFKKEILFNLFHRTDEKDHQPDYLENVMNMLEAIIENISYLIPEFIKATIKILEQKYVARLISNIKEAYSKSEQETEYLILILSNVIKLYVEIKKNPDFKGSPCLYSLQISVITIIQNLEGMAVLMRKPSEHIKCSLGESVTKIGFMKYHFICLVRVVLELDVQLVTNNVDLSKGLLLTLQKYLALNQWNNFMHIEIEKIVELLVNKFENYQHYEERYIGKEGFLCFLIERFRGRHFLFVESNNMSTYGYTHFLYNMAKNISVKLSQEEKLKEIMTKFEPWSKFIIEDLQKYEDEFEKILGGEFPKSLDSNQQIHSVKELLKEVGKHDEPEDILSDIRFVDNGFGWRYSK